MTEDAGHLIMLMDGQAAGVLEQGQGGQLRLAYDDEWRSTLGVTSLSLSMPSSIKVHSDRVVRAFLWGLLPDNEQVLERWARQYHVSPRNPYALLRHVGEDCAGAVQFVRLERLESLLRGEGGVHWIDEEEIAQRLRALRADPTSWHPSARSGQFSLAGAQAKTALHFSTDEGRWGDPWGSVPTTHILKPAIVGLDDHDLNEHICVEAARSLGVAAAGSRVATFGDERAIVVDRYDRLRRAERIVRVHQEDLCQALGVPPMQKYQNEGGPSPEQALALLAKTGGKVDQIRFVDALAYNWVIGGTDAHAKNYSMLLAGNRARLAPLYDLASALPYDDLYLPKLRMAMKIGGEYRLTAVSGRHWRGLAADADLDVDATLARVAEVASRTPAAIAEVAESPAIAALNSNLPDRLVDAVSKHAADCLTALNA